MHYKTCALVVFSALPSALAKEQDIACAQQGYRIFSLSDAHRLEPDIPLILPEINGEHLNANCLSAKKTTGL